MQILGSDNTDKSLLLLFSCEMKFSMELAKNCCRPNQCPMALPIASSNLSIHNLSLSKNRNKSALILVQSTRSKLTSCQEKGRLLRFEKNGTDCTATSDGSAQKLGNDVWHDSESITTKDCRRIA